MHDLIIGMVLGAVGFSLFAAISHNRDRNASLQMQARQKSGRALADAAREDGFAGDPAEIMGLIQTGKMIEAIKLIRAMTGLGLKESKDLAEKMAHGDFGALDAETRRGRKL